MRGDPYFLIARYPGRDVDGNPFPKGARVFYYPQTKRFLTGEKAEQAARDFAAAAADEAFMSGGY